MSDSATRRAQLEAWREQKKKRGGAPAAPAKVAPAAAAPRDKENPAAKTPRKRLAAPGPAPPLQPHGTKRAPPAAPAPPSAEDASRAAALRALEAEHAALKLQVLEQKTELARARAELAVALDASERVENGLVCHRTKLLLLAQDVEALAARMTGGPSFDDACAPIVVDESGPPLLFDEEFSRVRDAVHTLLTASVAQSPVATAHGSPMRAGDDVRLQQEVFEVSHAIARLEQEKSEAQDKARSLAVRVESLEREASDLESANVEYALLNHIMTIEQEMSAREASEAAPSPVKKVRTLGVQAVTTDLELARCLARESKQEVITIRFANEVLLQQMAEMRVKFAKYVRRMQKSSEAEKEALRQEADQWKTMVDSTLNELQDSMADGLQESLDKISMLQASLEEQKAYSASLEERLRAQE